MISRPTLFILGAGAHCPYGMPDGNSLTSEIIEALPTEVRTQGGIYGKTLRDVYLSITGQTIPPADHRLVRFRRSLALSGHPSIDSFLVTYKDEPEFAKIGKLAVAYVLRPKEFKQSFERRPPAKERDMDWMTYIFKEMYRGTNGTVEDFLRLNKVAFVTFNYDRTLEHFFYNRLLNTFNMAPADALQAMRSIQIHHVYGSLGVYDPDDTDTKDLLPTHYQDSANSIRLMYEERTDDRPVQTARALFEDAQAVIFLGFAFDEQNINLLNLNRGSAGKAVGATRFRVPNGDWERCKRRLSPTDITIPGVDGDRDWDCLKFLQETTLF